MAFKRFTLRQADGTVYLDRRSINFGIFTVKIHDIVSPDPGHDLHDHPWWFVSLILRGWYKEEYAPVADALERACQPGTRRGIRRRWKRGSVHLMRTTDAHRIYACAPNTKTLVITGRKVRRWGFFTDHGWVDAFDPTSHRDRPLQVETS